MIEFTLSRNTPGFSNAADMIGNYVQSVGGQFHTHRHHVTFQVPLRYVDFMILKFSFLKMETYVY